MICRRFAVVRVPFPFSDRPGTKPRPALVLTEEAFNAAAGHTVMAMITRAGHTTWPNDDPITDLAAAGLPAASHVRLEIFTLENVLVLRQSGSLAAADIAGFRQAARPVLG
jgi:mRNA interferase MazF